MNKNFLVVMLLSLFGMHCGTLHAVEDFDKRYETIVKKYSLEIWRSIRFHSCFNLLKDESDIQKFLERTIPRVYEHCLREKNSLIRDLYAEKIVGEFKGGL